jgi:hypothetical protein
MMCAGPQSGKCDYILAEHSIVSSNIRIMGGIFYRTVCAQIVMIT